MMIRRALSVSALGLFFFSDGIAFSEEIPAGEYAARRLKIMARLPDGIVLLHARSAEAALDQHNFKQDAGFFYFTGLADQPSAILALDGPRGQSRLFVPPAPASFGFKVEGISLPPGEDSARRHGLDHVQPWEELTAYLRSRLADGAPRIYVDEPRRPEPPGNPEPLWPMGGERVLFRRALGEALPGAPLASAAAVIKELRWVKSPAEVAALKRTGQATGAALLAGLKAIAPGTRQREAEAAVVCGCIAAGAEGPSFWPWTMSGPTAHVGMLVRALYTYRHLDRVMQPGELVRVDVGCDLDHYEGDVGRTVPVSGVFSPGQKETWDMLIRAYRAGLSAMKSGTPFTAVMEAARSDIVRSQAGLRTELGRKAATLLTSPGGMNMWSIHGVGIDAGETGTDRLEAGSVVAFEPMFAVEQDAFYLEDMIAVTADGYQVLSAGLPYTAEEIEAAMRSSR